MGFVSRPVWADATWVVASEQSVSPEILPYIAKQGFKWICSDEAVLGWTLSHFSTAMELAMSWNQRYHTTAWRRQLGSSDCVSRPPIIRFNWFYLRLNATQAQLIWWHLEAIALLKHRQGDGSTALEQPWLVTIALDGENCWEFYQQDSPS